MWYPLVILAIGILTVVGMIIVLRVNAFIALVTAAILVSLLSPGEMGGKIARVADAFGDVAGKIGIVIAMAAVIGKCLMDSGAADRIVRSLLKLMGQKQASVALLGSGFVLSVPVFFDTVFYLLVPLARSLWRRTRTNYVLYVTAIAAGAAITHTLVPPTPGPLVMAENLKIDLGVMIIVGTLIGLPMALVALLVSGVMNRWLDIPMRPYSGQPEPKPLEDEELPSLWISLAPVLLPVVLISTNTFTRMLADAEQAALVRQGDVLDWARFSDTLRIASTADAPKAARPFRELLPADLGQALEASRDRGATPELEDRVRAATGELVKDAALYREKAFAETSLSDPALKLRDRAYGRLSRSERSLDKLSQEELAMDKLSGEEVEQFNWLLLQATFPEDVKRTVRRQAAGVTALLGNANLALVLSAAIAMFVLVQKRRLSFGELAKTTETALMSGGVIILITAGGGAFGMMLREAGVKDSIVELVGTDGQQSMGLVMLLLGFAVASVMKVAQGSGTVSMITTSAMLAAMGASPEMLGCNPVYLAAAIGCGSLCGSWMNDSGFWIFARMSGFTEVEALKTWTVTLIILGTSGLGFTLLLAWMWPMV
jgi:H+/gluconate symporter-like permease